MPAQRRRCAAALQLRRELAQQRVRIDGRSRGALQPLLEPRDRRGEARRLHRLDEIVEHALREGLHGVLVVGRHEHDVRAAADMAAQLRRRSRPAFARRESRRRARAPRSARSLRGRCAPARRRRAPAIAARAAARARRAAAARRRRSGRWALGASCGLRARRKVEHRARRRRGSTASSVSSRVTAERELPGARAAPRGRSRGRDCRRCKPTPVSVTRTLQRPSPVATSTSMRPPSSLGSMPWRTAFSTSVSSVIGGQHSARRALVDSQRELQPIGHSHVHDFEIRAHELELLADRRRRARASAAPRRAGTR